MINLNPKIPLFLEGIYQRFGAKLSSKNTDTTLRICQRKKHSEKKPEYYLVYKTPETKEKYLSSLYPRDGWYNAEFNGTHYKVVITDNDASISKRSDHTKVPKYINRELDNVSFTS
jgi:hypothetical protein